MKKRILALLLLLLCYLLVGSIAPYTNQPSPSAQTQDSFQASDCYGVSVPPSLMTTRPPWSCDYR